MALLTPIKGFTNTPVTKSICLITTIATLSLLILSLKPYVVLAIDPFIVQYGQYWRVATFQLSVVNESDFLLSMVLWFQFKTLERFFGPKKYLSTIVLFALYNSALTFLVMSLGQLAIVGTWATLNFMVMRLSVLIAYFKTIFNAATPGPLGILSLLYVCHAQYIPVTYLFKLLLRNPKSQDDSANSSSNSSSTNTEQDASSAGASSRSRLNRYLLFDLTLTNHFQTQIIYTILLFNQGFSSIIPCFIGVLIGKLYTLELLIGSKTWVMPSFLFELFVNPSKARASVSTSIIHRFRGYQPISELDPLQPQSVVTDQSINEEAEEDQEMAIEDLRNQDENAAARSATPVRPLGRRFLDTFRA